MNRRGFARLLVLCGVAPIVAPEITPAYGGQVPKPDQAAHLAADPIGYFEIAGPNAGVLARFYEQVFGWKPAPGPFPNYMSMAGDAGAGLAGGFRQEEKPERVLYIRVSDLDASLAKVVAAGGRVLIPPTNVPGVVHFALFEDPQGNRTGLITS